MSNYIPQKIVVYNDVSHVNVARRMITGKYVATLHMWPLLNTLRSRQDGRRFPDDTFERIFLNENVIILIEISLKFVASGPINNIPVLVQIMAWRRQGDKPLTEPMMVRLPTHICVTRPPWVIICHQWSPHSQCFVPNYLPKWVNTTLPIFIKHL